MALVRHDLSVRLPGKSVKGILHVPLFSGVCRFHLVLDPHSVKDSEDWLELKLQNGKGVKVWMKPEQSWFLV